MKIIIDSDIPYIRGVFENHARVEYIPGRQIDTASLRDADALITRTRTVCGADLLTGTRVRAIATATIGTDHIDTGWCGANGIKVFSSAGCNARGVLQWVAAVLAWECRVNDLQPEGLTFGVVGCGNVGSKVAAYARRWGFEVLCCDPFLRDTDINDPNGSDFISFETVSARSEIISFHVPLTSAGPYPTYGMAGDGFFKIKKPGQLILNSSRGGIVDEELLVNDLRSDNSCAAIDTWTGEPAINRRLLELVDIATPHVAGYSAQGKAMATAMAVRAIAGEFGLPLTDWYPAGVEPVEPRLISWNEMVGTIARYYDISKDNEALKNDPGNFEVLRDNYSYRQEYF